MHDHDPFTRVFWTFWFYKRGSTSYGISLTNHGVQFQAKKQDVSKATDDID